MKSTLKKVKKAAKKEEVAEVTEEKKTLKERAKEFGENHPKVVKWGKRIGTGVAVIAAGCLGYKAGQESMIDDIEDDILDDIMTEE